MPRTSRKYTGALAGGVAAVSLVVFVIDTFTPLGIPIWIPYLVPVLLTFWLPQLFAPLIVATACSALIVLAFFLSPAGEFPGMALINRFFGIVGLEVTALLVLQIKKADGAMQVELAERTRAEESVRRSEAQLRAILDAAFDAVVGADAEGRIIYWNPRAERLFSWRSDEMMGRRLEETIIPPAYREAYVRGMRRLHATGESVILNRRVEFTAMSREGREFPVELIVVPVKNDRFHQFHAFIEDITERKQKEQALQASEERFRAIAEASPIAMVISREADGVILYANEQFGQLVGLAPERVLSRKAAEFYDDPANRHMLLSFLDHHGFLKNHEVRFRKANGDVIWAIISIHRVTFDGEPALLCGLQDLTDRKRTEEQLAMLTDHLERLVQERTHALQAANEKLQEHDRLKSAFVSIVSHELRTPMTSIKGYVENLLEGLPGPLTEKQTYYLTRIVHNIERLTRMLNDLLDLSRIEAGRVGLNVGPVSIADL
ncbi:MAG: PAS domain S-box protein, partial [Nitrospiraceae bacterium]